MRMGHSYKELGIVTMGTPLITLGPSYELETPPPHCTITRWTDHYMGVTPDVSTISEVVRPLATIEMPY